MARGDPAYPPCGLTRDQQKQLLRENVPNYDPKYHDGEWFEFVKREGDKAAKEWIDRHTKGGVDPNNCQ